MNDTKSDDASFGDSRNSKMRFGENDDALTEAVLPECFGDLERVFPMGNRGLRETPDDCMYLCPHKTSCLRQAMAGVKGLDVKEEMVRQRQKTGLKGFFERWSEKKNIHRQKTIMEKKDDISKGTGSER